MAGSLRRLGKVENSIDEVAHVDEAATVAKPPQGQTVSCSHLGEAKKPAEVATHTGAVHKGWAENHRLDAIIVHADQSFRLALGDAIGILRAWWVLAPRWPT